MKDYVCIRRRVTFGIPEIKVCDVESNYCVVTKNLNFDKNILTQGPCTIAFSHIHKLNLRSSSVDEVGSV